MTKTVVTGSDLVESTFGCPAMIILAIGSADRARGIRFKWFTKDGEL